MVVALQKDQELAAHWKTQIELCDKATNKWRKRAEKICENYRDERSQQDAGVAKRLNLFWSNVQTLKPVIYSKVPVPICERRFLDKDTVGRFAATILERALRYEVAMCGLDRTLRRVRDDYLIPGRGQAWVRYDPKFGEPISPKQSADDMLENVGSEEDDKRQEEIDNEEREFLAESLCADYVHWKDFYIFPANARTWQEVEGVGRRLFLSRDDMKQADFEAWKTIPLDHVPKTDDGSTNSSTQSGQDGTQATIFEIWWKPERRVYFIAKSHDKICKEADDPLKLEGFFPCPEPLSSTMTNDTMIPVPDYAESQDQYIQIDELTKRIDILTASCKVIGVYDAAAQSLKRVFEEAEEPNLIPVDSWAMFAEKGGLKGAIDWVPIDMVSKTLQILIEVRAKVIEDLDRTTGISDIMRGTSDARETMGGQRLKSNNSSTRIRERQDDMARFARDVISIMGEIISEHYSPETLIQVSGAMYDEGLDVPPNPMMGHNGGPPLQPSAPPMGPAPMPPQQMPASPAAGPQSPSLLQPPESMEQKDARKIEMIAQAIQLLRQDKLRGFRIDIETDSTIQGDAEQEKAQRIEFLTSTTKFIETAAQVTQMVPEFAPLAAKMLAFGVRGFRVGRDLESAIEEFCEKAELDAKQKALQPPKPTPEEITAQGDIQRQQIENQGEQENNQANLQMKQMDMQIKQLDIRVAEIRAQAELQANAMEAEKAKREDMFEQMKHQRENDAHQRDMERGAREHAQAIELGEAEHRRKMTEATKPADKKETPQDDMLKQIHEHMKAPVEFVRDGSGRLAQVKKGNVVYKVSRDERGINGLVN